VTPEYTWDWFPVIHWNDTPIVYYWGRRERVNLADVRALADGLAVESAPSRTNQYVYSALGPIHHVRVYSVSRAFVLLVASGAVLAAGLILIYLPRFRRPGALLVVAVSLAALAIWSPAAAVVGAQCSILGLLLLVAAVGLQKTVLLRRGQRGVLHGAADLSGEARSHHSSAARARLRVDGGSQITTRTAALGAQPAPELRP
jgi:hypothetical protein